MYILKIGILGLMLMLISFTIFLFTGDSLLESIMALTGIIVTVIMIEYYTQQLILFSLLRSILQFLSDQAHTNENDEQK